MRIKVVLDVKNMTLPANYYHMLQAIIYKNLPKDVATYLHDSDKFKGFNFSRLLGRSFVCTVKETNGKIVTFLDKATFYISSDDQNLLLMLANNLEQRKYIMFGHYVAPILSISEFYLPIEGNKIHCRTLSPVTIHTTEDGKTIYYNPLDNKFFDLLNANFSHKIDSVENNLLKFSDVKNINKEISVYKHFVIEAYKFEFCLEGNIEDLERVLSFGLGDRNSQGYGMIEIVK